MMSFRTALFMYGPKPYLETKKLKTSYNIKKINTNRKAWSALCQADNKVEFQ